MASALDYIDRAAGVSLTDIAKRGFGGWLLAIAASAITGMQALLNLFLAPIRLMIDLMRASINAFFLEPLGIVIAGSNASTQGVMEFGIFGLLVAVAIVLTAFYMVIQYLQEAETTDVPIPGLVSNAIPFFGAEEEADPQD